MMSPTELAPPVLSPTYPAPPVLSPAEPVPPVLTPTEPAPPVLSPPEPAPSVPATKPAPPVLPPTKPAPPVLFHTEPGPSGQPRAKAPPTFLLPRISPDQLIPPKRFKLSQGKPFLPPPSQPLLQPPGPAVASQSVQPPVASHAVKPSTSQGYKPGVATLKKLKLHIPPKNMLTPKYSQPPSPAMLAHPGMSSPSLTESSDPDLHSLSWLLSTSFPLGGKDTDSDDPSPDDIDLLWDDDEDADHVAHSKVKFCGGVWNGAFEFRCSISQPNGSGLTADADWPF